MSPYLRNVISAASFLKSAGSNIEGDLSGCFSVHCGISVYGDSMRRYMEMAESKSYSSLRLDSNHVYAPFTIASGVDLIAVQPWSYERHF